MSSPSRLRPLVAALVIPALAGCKGMISVKAVGPNLKIVLDRHDAYVGTSKAPDGSELSDVQKRTQLRSSRLLREALEAAEK